MRTRRTAPVALATLMCESLTACGSDAAPKPIPGPDYATITASAQQFSVPNNPQRSQNPLVEIGSDAGQASTRSDARSRPPSPASARVRCASGATRR